MTDKPIHRIEEDVPRFLVEALAANPGEWLSLDVLTERYKPPPQPNDMTELRAQYNAGSREGFATNQEVVGNLLDTAVEEINRANDGEFEVNDETVYEVIEINEDGDVRLVPGVDAYTLRDHRSRLPLTKPLLTSLFDLERGELRENIRTPDPNNYRELTESMREFGWMKEFPALADQDGNIIVGHRRLHVAEQLGIDPVIKTVTIPPGEAGAAHRFQLALISNAGAERISGEDRKRLARLIYGKGVLSMVEVGKVLKVSAATVYRDVRSISDEIPRDPKRGGRPRNPEPEPQPAEPTTM